ncbi:MAG TPA: hypothetical protein VMG10_10520 [Gemmataceae bacterium]|nr:hypothetical protein [Gemmataceae bacterium]
MSAETPFPADHDSPTGDSRVTPRRWQSISWLTVLAIGWVLYELTAQPALGSVAVCVKFGWDDFLTAIWLRRRDPHPYRGRTCFWLYLAGGLWNTAVVAGIMLLAFAIVGANRPNAVAARGRDPLLESVIWTSMTTLVGLSCSALAFTYAAALAWRGGLKLWLSRGVHAARRRNAWPPTGVGSYFANRAGFMVVATLFVLGIPLILAILFGVSFLIVGIAGLWWLPAVTIPSVVIGGSMGLLYCVDLMKRHILAELPQQCWDPALEAEGMA